MNSRAVFSRRSLLIIIVFMGMLLLGLDAGCYYGLHYLTGILSPGGSAPSAESVTEAVVMLQGILERFMSWYLPISAGGMALLAFILWMMLKVSTGGLFDGTASDLPEEPAGTDKGRDPAEQRMEQERKRRLFLHFLSGLRRGGRLLDFFAEDLSAYDDEQIGAAVRSIHEDCRKAVDKYLSLKPVIDKEEGESIEIAAGFDPDAVKLTGNVTGEPPFRGTLRHRGWKAGRKEVPRLADVLDSGIISPAEVEIG